MAIDLDELRRLNQELMENACGGTKWAMSWSRDGDTLRVADRDGKPVFTVQFHDWAGFTGAESKVDAMAWVLDISLDARHLTQ